MAKFYAVKNGLIPGIYTNWDECKANVNGFKGAIYKSFTTIEEAEQFINDKDNKINKNNAVVTEDTNYCFVDGSFNQNTSVFGCGGFLIVGNDKYIIQDNNNDAEMASMRNVAGEILGAIRAVEKAIELGLDTLTIYYDYQGIESWVTGEWTANKIGTIKYRDYIKGVSSKIKITFKKVKGHTGIEGNEEADKLAKQAVGIEV